MFLFGGAPAGQRGLSNALYSVEISRLSEGKGTWERHRPGGKTPLARQEHSLTAVRRGKRLVLFGGAGELGELLGDVQAYAEVIDMNFVYVIRSISVLEDDMFLRVHTSKFEIIVTRVRSRLHILSCYFPSPCLFCDTFVVADSRDRQRVSFLGVGAASCRQCTGRSARALGERSPNRNGVCGGRSWRRRRYRLRGREERSTRGGSSSSLTTMTPTCTTPRQVRLCHTSVHSGLHPAIDYASLVSNAVHELLDTTTRFSTMILSRSSFAERENIK